MVKKSSFFDKLKHRWKSPSGVQVGGAEGGDRVSVDAASRIGEGRAGLPGLPAAERVPGHKMSPKEEAVLAMGEGFRELSGLLRGVQTRMEDQGERASRLAEEIGQLPVLGRSQLDVLRRMAEHIEKQGVVGNQLLQTMRGVPEALRGIEKALEKSSATEQRTSETLTEFRKTMDRIHGSMGDMVSSSKTQADATAQIARVQSTGHERLVESLRDGQREGVDRLEAATGKRLDALRKAQDEQAARLGQLVSASGRWSKLLAILLGLTVVALAAIFTVLALR